MNRSRWSTRTRVVAAILPLFLAACGEGLDKATAPLSPQMNLTDPPTVWKVNVCKFGPDGSVANFSASATSGTIKVSDPFSLEAIPLGTGLSCVVAWEGAAGTPVTFTVTELASPGLALEKIVMGRDVPGYTINGATVTLTEEYLSAAIVNGSAVIQYKNVAAETPLVVNKTAAGRYEIPVRWELTKSVNPTSHSGTIGQTAGSSTWTVTATRIEGAPTNHVVDGTISVTNPAGNPTRTFSVSDVVNGVTAAVNCPDYTLDAGESVVCSYSAAVAGATTNTAVVSTAGQPDVTATAAVVYTSSFTGDQVTTLGDPRFTYSQSGSGSRTISFPETFNCPSDVTLYVNGTYSFMVTNTATLKGDITDLSRSATVNVTCTNPRPPTETATGAGFPWAATQGAPSNWFMYTPWVTTGSYRGISATATSTQPAGTNLIAGQHYIAGRITGSRGTSTTIVVTLNSAWGFAEDSDIKVNPMSCTTAQPYVSPGQFTVHKSIVNGAATVTISGLPNTACYGIHGGVYKK